MDTKILAERFVYMVLSYKNRFDDFNKVKKISAKEHALLFSVLERAGFSLKKIVPGKLYCENGETNQLSRVNKVWPFKIISIHNREFHYATGWLDCAVRLVLDLNYPDSTIDDITPAIVKEMRRSTPLKPIPLTTDGDFLKEKTPLLKAHYEYFVDHAKDNTKLEPGLIGVHMNCGGHIERQIASSRTDLLICEACRLPRISLPREIKTYGDLRKEMNLKLGSKSKNKSRI